MRDLIRNYRNTIKPMDSVDSSSESQPLVTSASSCGSFGSTDNQCMFHESDTTDCDVERARPSQSTASSSEVHQVPAVSRFMRRPFCFPGRYEAPTLNIFAYEDKINQRFNQFSKINGILTVSTSSLMKGFQNSNNSTESTRTQSSLVTIFVIWNTIIGSSILAMPWGLERAGLVPGIFLIILVAGICLYTCNTFLEAHKAQGYMCDTFEISDLCGMLLGKWAEVLAKIFSLIVLLGSAIVYWVLMSNFLYNSVQFMYSYFFAFKNNGSTHSLATATGAVICPTNRTSSILTSTVIDVDVHQLSFNRVWDLYSTVPMILAILMFPILNFKSATFFTKFNSVGTLSVLYMLVYVLTKAFSWGINVESIDFSFSLKPTFCALSGMLSLSYFIHNMIISVMKNNKHQCNNTRDLGIAFGLVAFTYTFVGVIFYISFPLPKSCFQDNFLNNFDKSDPMTIAARLVLLFQLFTVFPLIAYVLRLDVLGNINMIYRRFNPEFSYGKVIAVNLFIVSCCVLFACFLPKIGTLIRYTGSIGGLVYIFLLPSLIRIALLRKENKLTPFKLIFHIFVVVFGVMNLISQFFIKDS